MFSIFINKLKQAPESAVKTTFSIRIIFCILSLAFITLSCGSGAYEPEQNTSQDDLTNETTGSIYPHAAGFKEPDSHGQYTLANDIQSCETCHGADLSGGLSNTSCRKCHDPYPHSAGWSNMSNSSNHGKYYVDNYVVIQPVPSNSECATACHGENFLGKDAVPSCYECHNLFPHDADWENIANHGVFVKENGSDSCQTACHGLDLSGGVSTVSCRSCHDAYPHNADWINMSSSLNHGEYALENGINACASACHGTEYTGGDTEISCFSCHDPYPHPAGWLDWDNHGEYYVDNYVIIQPVISNPECATACHGENFSGTDEAPACDSCHSLFPHNADWTTIDNPSNHGRFYVANYVLPTPSSNDECASNCHGTDFSGGGSTVSCDSCHNEGVFPHVDQGQTLWKQTGHQDAVNITLGTDAVCTECHSDYLKGIDGTPLITCTTYCHQPE